MPTNRLRGNNPLIFDLKKGTAAKVSLGANVKSYELTPAEGDEGDMTFEEAAAGLTADITLSVTAAIDLTAGSLWNYLWENPGADVTMTLAPFGNATPSVAQPHFTALLNTQLKPSLSNQARTGKEGAEFTHEFQVVGDVTKVTA